jgi:hypothetical protein
MNGIAEGDFHEMKGRQQGFTEGKVPKIPGEAITIRICCFIAICCQSLA